MAYVPVKAVKRIFELDGWKKPIVMTVHPDGVVELRLKRESTVYMTTVGRIFQNAALAYAEHERAAKREERAARKAAR